MSSSYRLHTVALLLLLSVTAAVAQSLQNPILFVTQVPTPYDSANVSSLFGNHVADMPGAPRGGDLWIRYTDGTLKNLTRAAGFGVDGQQGTGAIAVREPSVHWNGTKAVFSMVVGGAVASGDTSSFYWQLYEITGLGKNETPTITKVPNQPANFNNVSPIYGTDDRIMFTSDRTRTGERHLYPLFDEYKGTPSNSGLWSLDPATGDLFQMDYSPSGDFSPTMDSYGRVLVMRWDRLQRDRNADIDALGTGVKGTFNYTDESATGMPQYNVRTEIFPEPQGSRTDLLNGTNMVGFEFNSFFPWQINEDGTTPEVLNHLGRHEMRSGISRAITDDSNVVNFAYATSGRSNKNPIVNFMQVKEDPTHPGTYFGVDALQAQTHSGGEIVSLTADPTLDPDQTAVTYVTNRATQSYTPEGGTPNAKHSGFYRNPLPMADGKLIVAHSADTHIDKNLGTRGNPSSRYTFRLQTTKLSGADWVADQYLTAGISKSVTYWDPDTLVHFSGTLWELDPVEVRARQRPQRRTWSLPSQEQKVFADQGVDEYRFRQFLKDSSLALAVSRDVTHRDAADHQQPFYLRITGTSKQSANPNGKIYDVSFLQFFQGDQLRGFGLTSQNGAPKHGRRILAVPMHDTKGMNPALPAGPASSVQLAGDGSMAGFVPARRGVSWQLTAPDGAPVVRERYWVTFQPGEIRVCASCHGTNDAAISPKNPIPQNEPEALRSLLAAWKAQTFPMHTSLISPAKDTTGVPVGGTLTWQPTAKAVVYRVQLSTTSAFDAPILDRDSVISTLQNVAGLAAGATYYWRVRGENPYGDSDWSEVWKFTTAGAKPAMAAPILISPPDGSTKLTLNALLTWNRVAGSTDYHVQVATTGDFASALIDRSDVTGEQLGLSNLTPATTYYWRVAGMDASSTGPWSPVWNFTTASPSAGVVGASTGGSVTALRLGPNRPNPFTDATTLEFYLPRAGRTTLRLFDLTGRQVAGLVNADLEAGGHSFQLDMRRPELQGLNGGVYAVQLSANGQTTTWMIELVR